jgi:hypothetical protein
MPETAVAAEERRDKSATFKQRLLQDCYTADLNLEGVN